jgi:hypothetical protein
MRRSVPEPAHDQQVGWATVEHERASLHSFALESQALVQTDRAGVLGGDFQLDARQAQVCIREVQQGHHQRATDAAPLVLVTDADPDVPDVAALRRADVETGHPDHLAVELGHQDVVVHSIPVDPLPQVVEAE